MNILGKYVQPRINAQELKTIDVVSNGFVWKVPQIGAELMRVNNMQPNKSVMMPISREVGNKLSILA
ncbi:MAG: hypothetical protein AB1782_10300 [Cyanobacteriota bacterium]